MIAFETYVENTKPVVYVAEAAVVEQYPRPAIIEVDIDWTEERIKKEVWSAAAKYNTFPEKMWSVMKCENAALDPTLQSYHRYTFSDPSRGIHIGEREKSFGLSQIHLPDHDVTYEQATDPEFAIDYMAKHFAEGKASLWSCYKMIY